jgi:hypothetical protein
MGTTLTGTTPQDTYDSLIKVTDNGPLSGTLKALSDGLGNDSTLSLSTSAASIAGTLAVATGTNLATASGNVGIGTSSPAEKLSVAGAIITTGGITGHGANRATFSQEGGNGAFIQSYGANTSTVGALTVRQASSDFSVTQVPLFISTSGVLEILSGIKFPATQVASADANTLDDYEEGTWTMGVSFGGASVGVTYANNTGTYTKIGRQVTVNGVLILTSKGSSTGVALITGLPFTVGNANSYYPSVTLRMENVTFANQFQAYVGIGSNVIALDEITEAGVNTELNNNDFANNSTVMVNLTYFV